MAAASASVPAGFEADVAANWLAELLNGFALLPDLLHKLPIGLHIEDQKLHSIFVNDGFVKIFGYTLDEIATPELWWPLVYPDVAYRAHVQRTWFAAIAEARAANSEIDPQEWRVSCRDGTEKVVQFHCRWIGSYHVHAYVDVSARHRLEAELRHLAHTDSLTGVANRRCFFSAAAEAMATGLPLALILFDLDHFKSVNDRFGHDAGDHVLTEVAGRCRATLGGDGLLARLGGEEFAVLLTGADRAQAAMAAEQIRVAVDGRAIRYGMDELAVTISLGGALRRDEGVDIGTLLARADRALYAAKRDGRNRVSFDETSHASASIRFPGRALG